MILPVPLHESSHPLADIDSGLEAGPVPQSRAIGPRSRHVAGLHRRRPYACLHSQFGFDGCQKLGDRCGAAIAKIVHPGGAGEMDD